MKPTVTAYAVLTALACPLTPEENSIVSARSRRHAEFIAAIPDHGLHTLSDQWNEIHHRALNGDPEALAIEKDFSNGDHWANTLRTAEIARQAVYHREHTGEANQECKAIAARVKTVFGQLKNDYLKSLIPWADRLGVAPVLNDNCVAAIDRVIHACEQCLDDRPAEVRLITDYLPIIPIE